MKADTITNGRVIAGIIRECILAGIETKINNGISGTISALLEADRRSGDEKRRIQINLFEPVHFSKDVISIEVAFSNFIAFFDATILRVDANIIEVLAPTIISISNLRSEKRIAAKSLDLSSASALICSDGRHLEAAFRLVNVSRFGVAGLVEIDHAEDIAPGALFSTALHNASGKIEISGRIVAAAEHSRKGDTKVMRIRLLRDEQIRRVAPISSRPTNTRNSDTEERRNQRRFEARFELVVRSLLTPTQLIQLEVIDVSVAGFSARCSNQHLMDYVIPGVPLKREKSSMVADVISVQDDIIRCHWSAGNDSDRSEWLKKISRSINDSVTMSLPDAERLMDVFCSSGAFSSEFLRSQRSSLTSTLKNMEEDGAGSAYIHRWIDHKNKNTLSGHISCIRMGDNAWFATDLVKSAEEDVKLSEGFVTKFLHSFSHYAESLVPVPRTFLIWVKDHPYWAKLEKQLNQATDLPIYAVSISYMRTPKIEAQFLDSQINLREVLAANHAEISSILEKIKDKACIELARAFDFDPDRFASPRLHAAIARDEKVFWRRYFIVETPSFEGLVVLTALPDGMNPNRIIDSAWFFEFDSCPVTSENDWLGAVMSIKSLASSHGMFLAGIRRVVPQGKLRLFPSDHAEMAGYLAHPRILMEFE